MIGKKLIYTVFVVFFVSTFWSQGMYNNGMTINIDSASHINIDGSYTNNTNSFIANQGRINIKGDWINNGSNTVFSTRTGVVEFSKPIGNQNIIGATRFFDIDITAIDTVLLISGTQEITGALNLASGIFKTNNLGVIFSDSIGTGRVSEITNGDVLGNLLVQRYIGNGPNGWRDIASSITTTTLNDWSGDFITSGFPGSDFPSFPYISMWTYDETLLGDKNNYGWVAPTSINQNINVGTGVIAYIGPLPKKLDVFGTINKGDIALPVSYTVSDSGKLHDGWTLIGNPYPAPINWDSPNWAKTNIEPAIYIWDATRQQYATYLGGSIGTNGGTNVIASSQSFWVQANGLNPSLTIRERCKSKKDVNFIKSQEQEQNLMRITLKGNGFRDETVIRFIDNATDLYDESYDAKKMYSMNTDVPSISTPILNNQYSINSFGTIQSKISIPLRTTTGVSGNYNLLFNGISSMYPSSCIEIEDLYTGTMYNAREDSVISFNLSDTSTIPRFILHIGKPLEITTENVSCFGMEDGSITINGQGTGPWNYSLTNSKNELIRSGSNVTKIKSINYLSPDNYFLTINDNQSVCPSFNKITAIQQPTKITANFKLPNHAVYTGEEIQMENTSLNATLFEWNFETTNGIDYNENPTYTYTTPGNYLIELKAKEGDCNDAFSKNITILSNEEVNNQDYFQAYQENGNIVIRFKSSLVENFSFSLYNLLGELVINKDVKSIYGGQVIVATESKLANNIYLIKAIIDNSVYEQKLYWD